MATQPEPEPEPRSQEIHFYSFLIYMTGRLSAAQTTKPNTSTNAFIFIGLLISNIFCQPIERVLQIGIVYFYCSSSSRWLKKNYPKHVIYIDGDSIYRDVRCYFILCILFSCGKLYSGWQYFLINVLCNA